MWSFQPQRRRVLLAGERARREHGVWLTDALRGGHPTAPRIPARKVSEGGYRHLSLTPEGRVWSEGWWHAAFTRTELSRRPRNRLLRWFN